MKGITPGPAPWDSTLSERKGAEERWVSESLPRIPEYIRKMAMMDNVLSEYLRQQKHVCITIYM